MWCRRVKPKAEWPAVKAFTKAIAEAMVSDNPDRYVSTITKSKRRGKILIDYLRNQRGATAVAPYSTRARPGAAVSMPLAWDELESCDRTSLFYGREYADAAQLVDIPIRGKTFAQRRRRLRSGKRDEAKPLNDAFAGFVSEPMLLRNASIILMTLLGVASCSALACREGGPFSCQR